ncbi:MAG: HEAT repeat domain-containing protein [Gemmatimonadales bacterium]
MDHKSTFIKRFGDLVALLRFEPGNDAAQDLALTASVAAVAAQPLEVEAGVEWSVIPAEFALKSRLLARQVECIRIVAGAEPHELLALARALSHDRTPIPSTPRVQVELVPLLAASTQGAVAVGIEDHFQMSAIASGSRRSERRQWEDRRGSGRMRWDGIERRRITDRRASGERRLQLIADQRAAVAQLHTTLGQSLRQLLWESALYAALGLVRTTPRVPSTERRTFAIRVRKALPRRAIEAFLDLAERDPVTREAVTAVVRYVGLDAAEAVIERLRQGDAIGVRAYYYEVLGGMPDSYPLVTPLLRGREAHEARHAVALLGRIGRAEGVAELEPLIGHRDERIRTAAVRALGEIHLGPSAEPLRQALHSPDPRTRSAAADAIAVWRGGALALLLVGALQTERDRDVWHAQVAALGRIGTAEACAALGNVALNPRKFMRRGGYNTWQQLAAVTALGHSDAPFARATLQRISREGEGAARYAAHRVMNA